MSSRELISFDWAMKRLLRNKANFGILNGFLTELIQDEISVQHILESESNRENEQNKSNRLDLLCVNQKDELIAIEIQYYVEPDYFHRFLFGVSKIITEYLSKGDPYALVKKVYSINILYFDLGTGIDYVYIVDFIKFILKIVQRTNFHRKIGLGIRESRLCGFRIFR